MDIMQSGNASLQIQGGNERIKEGISEMKLEGKKSYSKRTDGEIQMRLPAARERVL